MLLCGCTSFALVLLKCLASCYVVARVFCVIVKVLQCDF